MFMKKNRTKYFRKNVKPKQKIKLRSNETKIHNFEFCVYHCYYYL